MNLTQTAPSRLVAGRSATISYIVHNTTNDRTAIGVVPGATGPAASGTGPVVFQQLPQGMTLTSTVGDTGCAAENRRLSTLFSCSVPVLPPGGSATLTITAMPSAATNTVDGVVSTIAEVAGSLERSPGAPTFTNGGFDSYLYFPFIIDPGSTDLQLRGSASTRTPGAGAQISYQYQVRDLGPLEARALHVTDVLPTGVKASSATIDGGTCTITGQSVDCALSWMAKGTTRNVTIDATAPTTRGTFLNSATVTDPAGDPNAGNNTTVITATVR